MVWFFENWDVKYAYLTPSANTDFKGGNAFARLLKTELKRNYSHKQTQPIHCPDIY